MINSDIGRSDISSETEKNLEIFRCLRFSDGSTKYAGDVKAFKAMLSCVDWWWVDERKSGWKDTTQTTRFRMQPSFSCSVMVAFFRSTHFTFGLHGAVISRVSDVPACLPCLLKAKGKMRSTRLHDIKAGLV